MSKLIRTCSKILNHNIQIWIKTSPDHYFLNTLLKKKTINRIFFSLMERIQLFVHHGKCVTDCVYVDPRESLQNLDKYVNIPKYRFVFFNNNLLLGAFSYAFYKLKSGDHIYIVPNVCQLSTSKFKESFKNFINYSQDEKTMKKPNPEHRITSFIRETARLRDQFIQKVENSVLSRCNKFSKLTNMMLKPISYTAKLSKTKTVIPPKSESPSSDALPIMWNEEKTKNERIEKENIIIDENLKLDNFPKNSVWLCY